MKTTIITTTLLLIFGMACLPVTAQQNSQPKSIKQQQVNQQQRIHQGVKSGELTKKEAVHLQLQQAKIQQDKRAAKADGVVTPGEHAVIKQEQKNASRNIHQQKNDGQSRF